MMEIAKFDFNKDGLVDYTELPDLNKDLKLDQKDINILKKDLETLKIDIEDYLQNEEIRKNYLKVKNKLGNLQNSELYKVSNLSAENYVKFSAKLLTFYSKEELVNIDKKLFEQKFLVLNNDNFEDIDFSLLTNSFVGFDAFKFSVENPEYSEVLKYVLGEYSGKKIEIDGKKININSKEFFDEFRKFQKSENFNNFYFGGNEDSIMEAFIQDFPFDEVKNEFNFNEINKEKFDVLLILYKRHKKEIDKDFNKFRKYIFKVEFDIILKDKIYDEYEKIESKDNNKINKKISLSKIEKKLFKLEDNITKNEKENMLSMIKNFNIDINDIFSLKNKYKNEKLEFLTFLLVIGKKLGGLSKNEIKEKIKTQKDYIYGIKSMFKYIKTNNLGSHKFSLALKNTMLEYRKNILKEENT